MAARRRVGVVDWAPAQDLLPANRGRVGGARGARGPGRSRRGRRRSSTG
jgi:hypothetical protein